MSNVIKSPQVKSGQKVQLDSSNLDVDSLVKEEENIEEKKEQVNQVIEEAEREAQKIIKQAKQKAANIKEEAKTEMKKTKEEVLAKAKEEGYNEGLKTGKEEGRQAATENVKDELADLTKQLKSEIDSFYHRLEDRRENLKADIIKLSVAISKKIIDQELNLNREFLKDMIQQKLRLLEKGEKLKLRISPQYLNLLQDVKEQLISNSGYIEEIKIVADEEITSQGVIIETDFGGLDATISSQLEELEKKLLEVNQDE